MRDPVTPETVRRNLAHLDEQNRTFASRMARVRAKVFAPAKADLIREWKEEFERSRPDGTNMTNMELYHAYKGFARFRRVLWDTKYRRRYERILAAENPDHWTSEPRWAGTSLDYPDHNTLLPY